MRAPATIKQQPRTGRHFSSRNSLSFMLCPKTRHKQYGCHVLLSLSVLFYHRFNIHCCSEFMSSTLQSGIPQLPTLANGGRTRPAVSVIGWKKNKPWDIKLWNCLLQ